MVLLNHEADAAAVAEEVLQDVLGIPRQPSAAVKPVAEWFGNFIDRDTQLIVNIAQGSEGEIVVGYM